MTVKNQTGGAFDLTADGEAFNPEQKTGIRPIAD